MGVLHGDGAAFAGNGRTRTHPICGSSTKGRNLGFFLIRSTGFHWIRRDSRIDGVDECQAPIRPTSRECQADAKLKHPLCQSSTGNSDWPWASPCRSSGLDSVGPEAAVFKLGRNVWLKTTSVYLPVPTWSQTFGDPETKPSDLTQNHQTFFEPIRTHRCSQQARCTPVSRSLTWHLRGDRPLL